MMIVNVLYGVLYLITLVSFPKQKLLRLDELSILGFLIIQENRDGICCLQAFFSNLCLLEYASSKLKKLSLKQCLKQLVNTSLLLLLHLCYSIKTQVKSLVLELRCNSSCQLRARVNVTSLNTHHSDSKRSLSQKLPSAIFRARERVLSINSYLYRVKQKRKEAYNNVFTSIVGFYLILR